MKWLCKTCEKHVKILKKDLHLSGKEGCSDNLNAGFGQLTTNTQEEGSWPLLFKHNTML